MGTITYTAPEFAVKNISPPSSEHITAIIPAYNEGAHIGAVLNVVNQVNELTRILVIDDGSTDDTVTAVQTWLEQDNRVELIQLPHNKGKGHALWTAAAAAATDLLLFLDADLKGLQPWHIPLLLNPVRQGVAAMSVARFRRGRLPSDLAHLFLPYLSGQRCLRWPLFSTLFAAASSGWSIEIALNLHAWYNGYPVSRIPWEGVSHTLRPEKRQGLSGYWSHIHMWWDIGRYLVRFSQHYGLRPRATAHPLIHQHTPSPTSPQQPIGD